MHGSEREVAQREVLILKVAGDLVSDFINYGLSDKRLAV